MDSRISDNSTTQAQFGLRDSSDLIVTIRGYYSISLAYLGFHSI